MPAPVPVGHAGPAATGPNRNVPGRDTRAGHQGGHVPGAVHPGTRSGMLARARGRQGRAGGRTEVERSVSVSHVAMLAGRTSRLWAAVLLLDLATGTVLSANAAGREMTGELSLPVAIDEWSAAAGLRSPEGQPLRTSEHPLQRVASGQPFEGRLVGTGPGGEEDGAPRDLLWVVGLPLERQSSDGPVEQAVVVFVAVREEEAVSHEDAVDTARAQAQEALDAGARTRAFSSAPLSLVISDPTQPDEPLVWVNSTFLGVTGYDEDEVLGRNCRFLQGPGTDPEVVARIRDALAGEGQVHETLLNYRRDGSSFYNDVTISSVHDGDGRLVHRVAVQRDVTSQVLLDRERHDALAEVERTRDALRLLLRASDALAPLSTEEALDGCLRVLVPAVARAGAVLLRETDGGLRQVATRGDDLAHPVRRQAELADVLGRPTQEGPSHDGASHDGSSLDGASLDGASLDGSSHDGATRLALPLQTHDGVVGALLLEAPSGGEEGFSPETVALVSDIARRAGAAVQTARLHAREAGAAEEFQRSLLPVLPEVPGLALAARYVPSDDRAAVGGDWYDVLPLPDGAVGLCVGDVMGHDTTAAAAMGQVRTALRAYAVEGRPCGEVLDAVDRLVTAFSSAPLTTATYARLERGAGGAVLRWARAGHPPGLVRLPDGSVEPLDDAEGLLLGVGLPEEREEASRDLPVGSTVLLFTDGLVEVRGESLDGRTEQLSRLLAALGPEVDVEEACDRVLEGMGTSHDDDVALLVVRLLDDAVPRG